MNKTAQNLCILFWLNTPKMQNGKAPIYVRITIDGRRTQFSLSRKIEPSKWMTKAGMAKGNSEEARTLNNYINYVRGELQKHYNLLVTQHGRVLPDMVRNAYLGIHEEKKTLLQTLDYHNLKFSEKADSGYLSPETLKKYQTTRIKLIEYLNLQYKCSDIALEDLNLAFATNFEHFLLTKQKLHSNTAMKYIKNLKKIIGVAISLEWIKYNPIQAFKCNYIQPDRQVLTQEDLDFMYKKTFSVKRLDEVRDVFVFCCYTGFAYNEVAALTQDAIQKGIDGEKWIHINRAKTGTLESVMLLPIPLAIIEKYRENPYCKMYNKLLPVNSNQKYNAYLKEIADLCGFNIPLTTHIARHTFATTVTLANDVPIETVSSLLGHKDIRTTQVYAKVVKKKVSNDMKSLRNRLQKETEQPIIELNSKVGS
jgi:site-specific recombinase XerD